MNKLQGKTAVVTGASSGIGRAIAEAFAAEGAKVVLTYYTSVDKANEVVENIKAAGGEALAVCANVAKRDDITALIETAGEVLGPIDVWVNNAGADILTGDAAKMTIDEKLQLLINVDLKGTMDASWAIAPLMRKQGEGVILNMAWDLATHGFHGDNPQLFATTKAGIIGFSRSLALSYAPEIRVNVLAPGWIQTAFAEDDMKDDYYRARLDEIPLGRFGTPEDVAKVAVYLAGEDGTYITGEVIKINGGLI